MSAVNRHKKNYSQPFLRFLKEQAGQIPVPEIIERAKGMYNTDITQRQLYAVCHYYGYSLQPVGMGISEVARIMGVSFLTVRDEWIGKGLLTHRPAQYKNGVSGTGQYWITPGDLHQFLREHPLDYDYRQIKDRKLGPVGKLATERAGIFSVKEISIMLKIPYITLAGWLRAYSIPGVYYVRQGQTKFRITRAAFPTLIEYRDNPFSKRRNPPAPPALKPVEVLGLVLLVRDNGKFRLIPIDAGYFPEAIGEPSLSESVG